MSRKLIYPRDGHVDHRNKVAVPCETPGCTALAHLPDSLCDGCAADAAQLYTCPICGRDTFGEALCPRCTDFFTGADYEHAS